MIRVTEQPFINFVMHQYNPWLFATPKVCQTEASNIYVRRNGQILSELEKMYLTIYGTISIGILH